MCVGGVSLTGAASIFVAHLPSASHTQATRLTTVNSQAGFDVVERVGDAVERLVKRVREQAFRVGPHPRLVRHDLELRVEPLRRGRARRRLGFANVGRPVARRARGRCAGDGFPPLAVGQKLYPRISRRCVRVRVCACVRVFCPCWPASFRKYRKRNWRLRFDFSIVSMSVTTTRPCSPAPSPIKAQFLSISHPMAPAPTKKYLRFST